MSAFWKWLRRWLLGDRIRADPAEGAIYRLTPRSVVIAAGRSLEIVACAATDAAIVYDCDSDHGTCQLRAEFGSARPRRWFLSGHGDGRDLRFSRFGDVQLALPPRMIVAMFEAFQTMAIGLAVVLDSALLFVLLERRNRPFARVPIVNLVAGDWLLHVAAFLLLTVGPLPGFGADFRRACLLAMAAGMLLMPSRSPCTARSG